MLFIPYCVTRDTNSTAALDLSIYRNIKKCFVFIAHKASDNVYLYKKKGKISSLRHICQKHIICFGRTFTASILQ